MAKRQGQGCHHPRPYPELPDSGTEPGPISPGLILSPAQTAHGSEDGKGWVGGDFLGMAVNRSWLPASDFERDRAVYVTDHQGQRAESGGGCGTIPCRDPSSLSSLRGTIQLWPCWKL